jgi:hypothetical protein
MVEQGRRRTHALMYKIKRVEDFTDSDEETTPVPHSPATGPDAAS